MSLQGPIPISAAHILHVFPARAFCASEGVNHSEAIETADTLCMGDTYALRSADVAMPLPVEAIHAEGPHRAFIISQTNSLEALGTPLSITARLTFMTPIGASVDVLVIACDAPNTRIYLHPLGPLEANCDYMLIAATDMITDLPLAELTGMSFGRGAHITTATGAQIPVERLMEGDRILTRDNGMQPIRWIGKRTVQGVGLFAPVVIGKGALGNSEALIVSQSHRMMLSNWRAEVMTGSKDVLIEAQDLINEHDIYLRPGGFVEYTQLVFDEHQIIYAEGVASESLHLSPQILSGLPTEAATEILKRFPNLPNEDPKYCRVPLSHADAREFLHQMGHQKVRPA